MRVEKWREDAQPGELEDATAAEELRVTDQDGGSPEPGAIEDRWARLGAFPAVTGRPPYESDRNADRTVSLRGGREGAARHGDRADTDGPPDPRREPADAAPDRAGAPRAAGADAPRDRDRRFRLGERPTTAPRERRPEPRDGRADAGAPAAFREERPAAPRTGDRTAVLRGGEDPERTTMLRSPAAAKSGWPVPSAPAATGASVRDPWQEEPAGEPVAVTHDPHEVTVQLDAVQFGADGVLRTATAKPGGSQESADGPVFVDESGRRSRRYRRIGLAVGLACAGYAAVIVATLVSGNSDAPWLPVPGQQQERPAGKVETSPRPDGTDTAPGSGTGLLPGDSPSDGATGLPEPGASVPAPGATAGRDEPGASADPEPTATRRSRQPGSATGTTPAPQASEQPATTPPPASPPPADDPAPVTSAPAGDGGAAPAADPVAAPAADRPVAAENAGAEPAPTATSAAAPSPEYVL